MTMCSEIDKRTRDNPEAAMVHANQMRNYLESGPCQAKGDPWPWPVVAPVKVVTKNELREMFEPREPGVLPGFDSEAHRAFMRSLG